MWYRARKCTYKPRCKRLRFFSQRESTFDIGPGLQTTQKGSRFRLFFNCLPIDQMQSNASIYITGVCALGGGGGAFLFTSPKIFSAVIRFSNISKRLLFEVKRRYQYKVFDSVIVTTLRVLRFSSLFQLNNRNQEPTNSSLYLLYYALESPLSRVDLFIERLSGEVLHAHSSKTIKIELDRVYCFTPHSTMI